jgi:alpha-1,2-mannosyltransferase
MMRKIGRVLIVTALLAIAVLSVFLTEEKHGYFDSRVYYGAIDYLFHGDGMVYDWLRPDTPYGFTYPPFAGLTMAPMAVLSLGTVIWLAVLGTILSTALLAWWLAGPLIKRKGWTRWFAVTAAILLAIIFEPVRETIGFGQVNTLLLALVAGDMLFGVARGRKWAGIGIGVATAIKLTPGVFILYLLLTRRWRAAATAIGTTAAASLLGAVIFPDESREFWTSALWDTNRVGALYYLSNQSERGLLARLPIDAIEPKVWVLCVLATLAVWGWRVWRQPADVMGGLALTGVLGCLISPVTWIHHCVWLLPAIVRCVDAGLSARRNWGPLVLGAVAYLVMSSHLTWIWENHPQPPLAILGANTYVWFSLALLFWTPIGALTSPDKVPAKNVSAMSGPGATLPSWNP